MIWFFVGIFTVGLAVILLLIFKISSQLNQQMGSLTQHLNDRLKETSILLQDAHKTVGERLDSANRVFGDVQKSLGKLEETNKRIIEISQDISSLQDLLRAPKARGEIGETLLGKLLEDILPKDNLKFQHRFRSGETVDAAVVIGKNLIPIDAKFPLENFRRFTQSNLEDERNSIYKVFVRDVKLRIEEVASKYILPDEGTFDFALMYIPAEAIYYQISKDEELNSYAKSRKIIFVSPNTFYAYLQAILYGLKGINIQRNIQKIFSELSRVQLDFKKFQSDFDTIGGHISNAAKKYNEARDKLTQLSDRLINTTERKQIAED